jgi:hypothetical protein
MPEEPEIDADTLNERIHEELEREGGALLKTIALTTALFAALGTVAALLKTEATRLQAEASDQWAAYQAKGLKSAIQQTSQLFWTASGKSPPPRFGQEQQRYAREQAEIERFARDEEHQRDRKSAEKDALKRVGCEKIVVDVASGKNEARFGLEFRSRLPLSTPGLASS